MSHLTRDIRMSIAELRRDYHARICREIVCIKRGRKGEYPNFADADNATSIAIARGIVDRIAMEIGISDVPAQTAGGRFEEFTRDFLESIRTPAAYSARCMAVLHKAVHFSL